MTVVSPASHTVPTEARHWRRGFVPCLAALVVLVAACGDPSLEDGALAETVTTIAPDPVPVATTNGSPTELPGGGSQNDVTVTTLTDGPLGLGEGVNYRIPDGLSGIGIVEALGGRLQEGLPPIYPPFYVTECWDVYQGVYVLYITDPAAVDLELLEPFLDGAQLRLVTSEYTRDQLTAWWDQIGDGIARDGLVTNALMSILDPGFPESGAFCSQTGYYFDILLYPASHDADLTGIFAGVPPGLIRLTFSDVDPPETFP